MPKTMFDIIKKQNGERFAKAIRNYDNGIFDIPNLDTIVKHAGREAEPIMAYLISLKNIEINEMAVHMDPIKLLDRAGYNAYVVHNLAEQNAIEKYFARGEELCTFHDPHRFEKYYIINAVRKDVDNIRRADFKNPKREDEYGTSVISIQVLKTGGFISIKNRYNHTVENPDNTLNSNPDNIIPGLADAIKHHFNVDFASHHVDLPINYTTMNNQILKYNLEVENTYIGPDFYARDGRVFDINKDYEIILDTIVFNTKTKEFKSIAHADGDWQMISALSTAINGQKVKIQNADNDTKILIAGDTPIVTFQNGQILSLNLPNVREIGNYFALDCQKLTSVSMPDLETMGTNCFQFNTLEHVNMPKLREIGEMSFYKCRNLQEINLPQVQKMGSFCFTGVYQLKNVNMPQLRYVGDHMFHTAPALTVLDLPNLQRMGQNCVMNAQLKTVNLPQLQSVDNNCFVNGCAVTELDLPNLQHMGNVVFYDAPQLRSVNAPKLQNMGAFCFRASQNATHVYMPQLQHISQGCFESNATVFEKLDSIRNISGEIAPGGLVVDPAVDNSGTKKLFMRAIQKITNYGKTKNKIYGKTKNKITPTKDNHNDR